MKTLDKIHPYSTSHFFKIIFVSIAKADSALYTALYANEQSDNSRMNKREAIFTNKYYHYKRCLNKTIFPTCFSEQYELYEHKKRVTTFMKTDSCKIKNH